MKKPSKQWLAGLKQGDKAIVLMKHINDHVTARRCVFHNHWTEMKMLIFRFYCGGTISVPECGYKIKELPHIVLVENEEDCAKYKEQIDYNEALDRVHAAKMDAWGAQDVEVLRAMADAADRVLASRKKTGKQTETRAVDRDKSSRRKKKS